MPANFQDLVALMARLRSPEGCPWDREQTYATLAPMLLEEAYEAFEAVEEARHWMRIRRGLDRNEKDSFGVMTPDAT